MVVVSWDLSGVVVTPWAESVCHQSAAGGDENIAVTPDVGIDDVGDGKTAPFSAFQFLLLACA